MVGGRRLGRLDRAEPVGGPPPATCRRCRRSRDASLSYSEIGEWRDNARGDGFAELASTCWRTRAYGDFWSYMLVAEGAVDIAAEPDLKLHDMAALVPVVTEAGGRFTSLDGRDGPWGGSALATNGVLHDGVLDVLRRDRANAGHPRHED